MVGCGMLMILLALYGSYLALRKQWDKMQGWFKRE